MLSDGPFTCFGGTDAVVAEGDRRRLAEESEASLGVEGVCLREHGLP